MSGLHDETVALTVSEATMQDWHAAMAVMKQLTAVSGLIAQPAPHPVLRRPAVVRACCAAPIRRAESLGAPRAGDGPARVGGARSVYWIALAAALGAMTLL